MKKTIHLLDFIRTGSFGGVKLGMTPKEVVNILGKPTHDHGTPDSILLGYGWWEVHLSKHKGNSAYLIYNDHLLYDCSNHDEMLELDSELAELDLDFIKPMEHVRFHQVITLLNHEKIPYRVVNKPYQPMIQTENQVYLDFSEFEPEPYDDEDEDEDEDECLESEKEYDPHEGYQKIEKVDDWILYTIGTYTRN